MKKLFITLVMLLFCIITFSQTQKGSKLIGGYFASTNFGSSKSSTSYTNTPTVYDGSGSNFNIDIGPTVLFFVQNNLAIGGNIDIYFGSSSNKNSNTGSTTTSETKSSFVGLGIGPAVRYYFGSSAKGSPFTEINFTYYTYPSDKRKTTVSTGSSSTNNGKGYTSTSTNVLVGYEHYLSKHLSMLASIGARFGNSKYTYEYRPSTGTGYDYTTKGSSFSIPIRVGMQIHLPSKGVTKKK